MSLPTRQLLKGVIICGLVAACGASGVGDPQRDPADDSVGSLKKTKVKVTVAPATAQIGASQTLQFSASVTGTTKTAVTWTATGGTIDTDGKFTAGAAAGNFEVTATSTASTSVSAKASVVVTGAVSASTIKYVFVVAMENQDSSTIYGSANAPYLNGLMGKYGYASNYGDDYLSPNLPSEPHYLEMEAGTNAFSDHTFTTDSDPSASNSTDSTAHITTQMDAVSGLSWMSYQESMPSACPVKTSTVWAAKHDPFVFFQDVSFTSGKPDANNSYCAAHHKDFATSFASDVAANKVATYNYVTPDLCDDMHGSSSCSNGCTSTAVGYGPCISAGDNWLKTNLPPVIAFAEANHGVIFIVWDEAEDSTDAPFLVLGPNLKTAGYDSTVAYSHKSLVKSLDEILGLAVLSPAASANDFSDFFQPGSFP